ncbi:hypothetical protein ACIBCM_10315 [Streptomyces sp. NPDC051018]|uniref:hypothetical protein n=1 Tax=Streptomyces sp. NPDC051018 TaxID=3365639 RepID=UPI00378BF00D
MARSDGATGGQGGSPEAPRSQERGPGQPQASQGMSIRIGSLDGSAVNFGSHGSATTTNVTQTVAEPVQQRELLEAVRALREDLARFTATEDMEVLDAELVATEEEITASGAADRNRLQRLRDSLTSAGEVVAALGSGLAVGELVASLLGS